MDQNRLHIYFYGRVQGVGFRMTCREIANRYEVTGWVRNLSDGSVEMVVEGVPNTIRSYVAEVCESTHGRVDDRKITKSDYLDEFSSFDIRA